MEPTILVSMENIVKEFPGVRALDGASIEIRSGEVHALLGENGAGKSTLMKVLSGIYKMNSGRILYRGEEVEIDGPKAAQDLGISIIHQELNLMPHLTVAQNIFIGREPRRSRFFLDDQAINRMAEKELAKLRLKIDPRTKINGLTVAKQQMVEIAKALSFDSKVLVMDEPTAALTDTEIEDLFVIINELRASGVGIVYISHRLEELKAISDRITVLRDGQYVDTVQTASTSVDEVIRLMVGRTIYESAPELPEDHATAPIKLSVRNLNRGNALRDINFDLRKGEILGFSGLMGAGRTEVARAIFGADRIDSGTISIDGKEVTINTPEHAVKQGIGYLSEDRKRYGLTLGMDVQSNIVLAAYEKFVSAIGWVSQASITQVSRDYVEKLAIKTPTVHQKVKNLSGGNQQKVVISKWLTADTDILIFDEPTRGIDVGAKSEIYKLLNELAQQGKSIIMISSELPEILRMSHRILVMCEGRITGELSAEEASQEKIMTYATMRETVATA